LAATTLTLYHNDMSSSSQKVRLCLAEKGLEWISRPVSLVRGEHQEDWYRALNKRAVVPTLVHDGKAIQESTVINEYLDSLSALRPLMPETPFGRAQVRLWTKQVDDSIHDGCIAVLAYAIAFREAQLNDVQGALRRLDRIPDVWKRERRRDILERGLDSIHVRMALYRLQQLFGDLDDALAAGSWILGEQFTLADAAMLPYIVRLDNLGLLKMADGRHRVMAWFKRARQRQSYVEAIAAWEDQSMLKLMRSKGEQLWPYIQDIILSTPS